MDLNLIFLAFAGCDSAVDSGDGADSDTDSGADSATDSGTELRTLDTCGGAVGDSVPEPFASWFACQDVDADATYLTVHTNSLPPHVSPYYSSADANHVEFDTMGGERHQNPNTLSSQELTGRFALNPTPKGITITDEMVDGQATTSQEEFHSQFQGIGLDGTSLFTGVAAPGDDIYEEEYTFDGYEGHPTNTGEYHHHGANPAALAVLLDRGVVTTQTPGEAEIEFYGMMCDGTIVLGCTEIDGTSPSGSLDAQNGHVADLTNSAGTLLFSGRYHVHACAALGRTLTPEIQYYEDSGTCL